MKVYLREKVQAARYRASTTVFEWHGLAETFTQIHVHNCRAQNKNNALIDVVLPLDRSPCFGE